MKLRYLVGIPYLVFVVLWGGNIMFDAFVIGVLAGLTDMQTGNGNDGSHSS
jgi:hypothetical protein